MEQAEFEAYYNQFEQCAVDIDPTLAEVFNRGEDSE
jgi:hypothetical protein